MHRLITTALWAGVVGGFVLLAVFAGLAFARRRERDARWGGADTEWTDDDDEQVAALLRDAR